MKMKGIDVSVFQGDIDFEQVKNAGIDYVIIKAGVEDRTDANFETNYQKAKDAGLYVGFYWYCYGETIDRIKEEANACIKALEGKQFEFPIYMDLEEQSQYDLGIDFCSKAVDTFCGMLKKEGYYAGLYTSTSFLDNVIDDKIKKKYTLWVADWRGYCGYKGNYGMWQYGAGYVPGINGKTDLNVFDIGYDTDYPGNIVNDGVDLDYAYENFPMEIVLGGYNNFPKAEPSEAIDDTCLNIAENMTITGQQPTTIKDNWLLFDKSGKFTLTLSYPIKTKVYLVGGGQDGAEWHQAEIGNGYIAYDIDKKSQGGCVLVTEMEFSGTVDCQVVVAEANNIKGTSLKIGNEIYKCSDEGCVQRRASANGISRGDNSNIVNGENGSNGILSPCGYVGSSGGGGGTHSIYKGNTFTAYAGKGGAGAGNGGNVKENGTDATGYGCGGGSAGFGGFSNRETVVETRAGKGKGGCIIFEIIKSDKCNETGGGSGSGTGGSSGGISGGSGCCCPTHMFGCPTPAESTSTSSKETSYKLEYENNEPVETETSTSSSDKTSIEDEGNNQGYTSSCNCGTSNSSNSSCNFDYNTGGCSCGSKSSKCVSLDPEKWGENWLLFNKSGRYSLTVDENITLTTYLVGGGCDGKDGIYFNGVSYGGDGGRGGSYTVISDIKVPKGKMNIDVIIGQRGDFNGTTIIINNTGYNCNGKDFSANDGGAQGVCGKGNYQQAGNGANGIETPFGYIGSSGGGGAAYCNTEYTNRGFGGVSAGDGGKINNGKATPGANAKSYGNGGGGGAATSTSWCNGGRGRAGCAIINWN